VAKNFPAVTAEIKRAPQYILYIIKDKEKVYTETAPTVGDIFKIRGFSGICSRQVFRRMLLQHGQIFCFHLRVLYRRLWFN